MALEDYRNDMMRCVRCSVCKYIPLSSLIKSWRFANGCPASAKYHFHSYSGGGKLIAALSLLEGRIDYSDALVDVVYKCSMCGACDLACRVGTDMEPLQILRELRFRVFKEYGQLDEHKHIMNSIRNYDNVWMLPRSRRKHWSKGLAAKDLSTGKEKAEVLYFAGCTYSLDPNLQKVAQNTVKLLNEAGVDVGILGTKEKCCASPAFQIGNEELFEEYAIENIEVFNQLGVKKVVSSCAGCYGLFKTHYSLLDKDMDFEVVHAVEYLDELIQEGRLEPKKRFPLRVTYHDPCHLGRLSETKIPSGGKEERVLGVLPVKDIPKAVGMNGIFDPPRNILKSIPGVELLEMERTREYSWCCGSGGGVKSAFPEFALWSAEERLEEAKATGAEALVTCCPWCEKNLKDAVDSRSETFPVYDATDLLIQSL